MNEEASQHPAEDVSSSSEPEGLQAKVIEVLQTCYDPEIPVDIYELGLIYEVDVTPADEVHVKMTLTSP